MKAVAALNVYEKVAVIRRATDSLAYQDADGNVQTVTDLGHAASTAAPDQTKNQVKHDIPVPQIKMVESYDKDVPNNYDIKSSFVRYHRPSREEWQQQIEYVADAEDETWLINNVKFGGVLHPPENELDDTTTNTAATGSEAVSGAIQPAKRSQLPLSIFEHMMDLLEKATGFDVILSSGQAEHLICEKIPQIYQLFPSKGKSGVVTTKHVINDVYNYWVQKRSKLKRPLLRRFWPVTSTDDTNPHLVFRPREKEKYKLRKTRRNDMLGFKKMQQLRSDFENLRQLLDLVRKREELHRAQLQMQCELFEQKLFDITDTSGKPRLSKSLKKRDADDVLAVPTYFDVNMVTGKRKRGRKAGSRSVSPVPGAIAGKTDIAAVGDTPSPGNAAGDAPRVVAGQNFGEPAPNFLQPLQTRESYVTSWDNSVPHVTSYIEAHAAPTYRFKHRPRVGRGGRLCIDRLPCPPHPDVTPLTFFTAGKGLPRHVPGRTQEKTRLLEFLPEPIDQKTASRRIEALSIAALQEDIEIATGTPQAVTGAPLDAEENDGEEVLVKMDDWLETDGQLWGEERYAIGPV